MPNLAGSPPRTPLAPCLLLLVTLFLPGVAALAGDALEAPPAPVRYPPLNTEVLVPALTAPPATDRPSREAPAMTDTPGPEPAAGTEPVPSVTSTPPEPLAPPPLETLEIMLDWYPGPHHAALILATANGLLEHEGLDVTLSTPADPTVPTRLLAAGHIDLAVTRQPQLHLQVNRGQALIRVATLIDLPMAGLVLREDLSIDSPAGLAGLRIGYAEEDGRDLLLPALTAPHGIAPRELSLSDTGFGLASTLVEQRLDAVITPLRLTLPRQLADQGVPTRLLRVEEHGIPLHDGLILVANRDRLARLRDPIRELLDVLQATTAWILEHPDEAWSRLTELEPTLDTPANRDSWMATLLRLSAQPAALDTARYARFEAFLHGRGLVEEATPVERLAVDLGAATPR